MVDGLGVEILMWNDSLDDMLHQVTAQLVDAHLLGMLYRDDDCVDTQRHTGTFLHPILAGHLSSEQNSYVQQWYFYDYSIFIFCFFPCMICVV